MKHLLFALLFSSFSLTVLAQLDEQYIGRYTDNKDLTGIEVYPLEDEGLKDYCFMVSKDRYNEFGESVYSEIGFARCTMVNGQYAVEIESDEPNLWLTFETDQFGNKFVTTTEKGKPAETFFYNPLTDEVLLAEYDEDEYYQDPDIYLREDGVGFLIGEVDGAMEFMLIASDIDAQCASPDIDGTLEIVDAAQQSYRYTIDGCEILTVKIEGDKAIVTEKKCGNIHPNNCQTWSGVYLFNKD